MEAKFCLGHIVMTRAVNDWMYPSQARYKFLLASLKRHQSGDWGNVCAEDAQVNADSLTYGNRIMSVYSMEETPVWIITEADRSSTTILFPDDY